MTDRIIKESSEVMFFLGAGASVPAGIRDVVSLVESFTEWLRLRESNCLGCLDAVNKIMEIASAWNERSGIEAPLNMETLLEIIERLEATLRDIIPEFFKDKRIRLEESAIDLLKNKVLSREIKLFIQDKFQEVSNYDYYQPLVNFVLHYRPLNIFTTNYDLIIELFCEKYRLRFTDRFKDAEWNSEVTNSNEYDIILNKLHGSINWYRTERGKYVKLIHKTKESKTTLFTGEIAVPLILYPGRKLEYIEPTL